MQRWIHRARWAVLGVVLVVLQGCASIVSGTSQTLSVDTPGCAGARCELSNDKGKYFVTSTPGTVTVSRSYNNLQVVCSREAVTSDPLSVASTTKGMAFGNILFGGVIGAGVDIGTGAAYDYPQLISVAMQCGPVVGGLPPLRLGVEVARVEAVAGGPPPVGVKVLKVAPGSLAEQWGLQPGDVLLRVNANPILDPDGLAALVAVFGADRKTERELDLLLRSAGAAEDTVRRVKLPAAPSQL
jgi:membrane-associated protease RseP (regulator of RpoE activity)